MAEPRGQQTESSALPWSHLSKWSTRCGLGLWILWLVATSAGATQAEDDTFSLSILSYNVHGITWVVAKDNPRDRMPTIGWLARSYDIVLFQEDFEYHDELALQLGESANGHRGNGPWSRPFLALVKLLTFPFFVWVPDLAPPYGAGLSSFVDKEHDLEGAQGREAYDVCHGWIENAGDCWSAKGFQRVTVRAAEGIEVDVYNTHLEAGSSEEDAAARRMQLDQLADAIEGASSERAVIVAGDFNIAFIRPLDRDMFVHFRKRLGLSDSGAAPELPIWRERDAILYRSGSEVRLEVVEAGEALEFTSRENALSDHAALFARFALSPSR